VQQTFKLTEKQALSLDILTDPSVKDLMLYGGSRSGKTFLLVWAIFVRAAKIESRHVILRDKFNHVKRSIWLDTIPKVLRITMPDLRPKANNSDYFYRLSNGSEIWIGGLDSKERTEKILGTEYSTIYFNETSQIDYASINMAKTRLAEKNGLVKKAYYDSNPPTKASWQYQYFEKKLDPIDNVPLEEAQSVSSMLMNPCDNLENIDEDYLRVLSKLPQVERDRFLLGLYSDESDGQAYYEFKRDEHVREFERLPGTTFIASDFNVDPHCSFSFQFIDNKIWVMEEFFLRNSDTPKAVSKWSDSYRGSIVIPDSTGKNRKTSGQSDFDIIKAAGFRIESTHNPYVKDRVNNVNARLRDGRVAIHPRCKKLINDLEKVSWRNNELDQKTDPLLTHMSDCLGYACNKLMPPTNIDLTPKIGRR
jgi:PBSX family phage terminase large subunit